MINIPSEKCLSRNLRPIMRCNNRTVVCLDKTGPYSRNKRSIINSNAVSISNVDGVLFGKNHSLMLDIITKHIIYGYYGERMDYMLTFYDILKQPCPIDVDSNGPYHVRVYYDDIRDVTHFSNMRVREYKKILKQIAGNDISMSFTFRAEKDYIERTDINNDNLFLFNVNNNKRCFEIMFLSDLGLLWYRNCVDMFVNWYNPSYSFLTARSLFLLKKYVVRHNDNQHQLKEIYKFLLLENENNKYVILKHSLELLQLNKFIDSYRLDPYFLTLYNRCLGPSF